ncbi:unnamed protein product [Microthlaspi erraticum]|uniref:F-box domain-containing protein n=1 Tax=Microthlaspi erraticum TaxID=1685480 RepID=A0A6D2KTH9_9BRAS|nr:unnamed protein product [Microthlaspi erraticum]
MKNGNCIAAACIPSHRNVRRRELKEGEGVVSVSSLPDEILQHILCFLPTKLVVTTSVLSSRWRHIWCDTPSISLNSSTLGVASIMVRQHRYKAPKMMSLHLQTGTRENVKHINTWIELAMSRRVEKMYLELKFKRGYYEFPDFFYINSSVKELRVAFMFNANFTLIPKCSVSWASLKKLSLRACRLSNMSIAMILSGCPILEFLKLDSCDDLRVLDLSNSLRLRTLHVRRPYIGPYFRDPSPMQIVAPHVRCLKLINSLLLCDLVDLSSLAEAKLSIYFDDLLRIEPDSLGVLVVKMAEMLEKLHNVEKLTLGRKFIEILSHPELGSVPFPMFKIKALTLETPFAEASYVIPPAIEKLLQHSPDLKKLNPTHKSLLHKAWRSILTTTRICKAWTLINAKDQNMESFGRCPVGK